MSVIKATDKLVDPNTDLVVSLADFKQYINWDADDSGQDTVMTAYIQAATEQAQNYTGRQFLTATWRLYLDCFPDRIALSKTPVVDTSELVVYYLDENEDQQEMDAGEYSIRDGGDDGFLVIEFDGSIPSIADKPQAVWIEYEAGYGTDSTSVPNPIRVAVMIQAANYFANRESEQTGTNVAQLMNGFHQLLFPYKTFYHNQQ